MIEDGVDPGVSIVECLWWQEYDDQKWYGDIHKNYSGCPADFFAKRRTLPPTLTEREKCANRPARKKLQNQTDSRSQLTNACVCGRQRIKFEEFSKAEHVSAAACDHSHRRHRCENLRHERKRIPVELTIRDCPIYFCHQGHGPIGSVLCGSADLTDLDEEHIRS